MTTVFTKHANRIFGASSVMALEVGGVLKMASYWALDLSMSNTHIRQIDSKNIRRRMPITKRRQTDEDGVLILNAARRIGLFLNIRAHDAFSINTVLKIHSILGSRANNKYVAVVFVVRR